MAILLVEPMLQEDGYTIVGRYVRWKMYVSLIYFLEVGKVRDALRGGRSKGKMNHYSLLRRLER